MAVAVYLLPSQYSFIVVAKLDELLEAKDGIVYAFSSLALTSA